MNKKPITSTASLALPTAELKVRRKSSPRFKWEKEHVATVVSLANQGHPSSYVRAELLKQFNMEPSKLTLNAVAMKISQLRRSTSFASF